MYSSRMSLKKRSAVTFPAATRPGLSLTSLRMTPADSSIRDITLSNTSPSSICAMSGVSATRPMRGSLASRPTHPCPHSSATSLKESREQKWPLCSNFTAQTWSTLRSHPTSHSLLMRFYTLSTSSR